MRPLWWSFPGRLGRTKWVRRDDESLSSKTFLGATVITISGDSSFRLRAADFGWITTVRRDGQPQSSYVWFHFDGDTIFVISQPRAGKIKNIVSNSLVSFHLDGDGTLGNGVLTMECRAQLAPVSDTPERLTAYLSKYESRIRDALQSTPSRYADEFSEGVILTPLAIRAW